MASAAANATGTAISSPSIFELVSQQGFAHALRPAFQHVVKTLAQKYPEGTILPFLFRKFDEAYLVFDSLVQWHYMGTRGSTLSEAFYGLQRQSDSEDGDRTSAIRRIRLSYILSVIIPYLKTKMDKLHQQHEEDVQTPNSDRKQELVILIMKYYKYIIASLDLVNLICLMRYTFGYSKSHNLLFLLLGLRLTYVSPSRLKFLEDKRLELFDLSSWRLKRMPMLVLQSLGESILFMVEIGSFFVQFLDWWYNDPRQERVVLTSLPVPPPICEDDNHFVKVTPKEKDKCPMCRRKFKNATALMTSGLVYCYTCITPYLKQYGRCPVTSLPSTMNHLIRIFA